MEKPDLVVHFYCEILGSGQRGPSKLFPKHKMFEAGRPSPFCRGDRGSEYFTPRGYSKDWAIIFMIVCSKEVKGQNLVFFTFSLLTIWLCSVRVQRTSCFI